MRRPRSPVRCTQIIRVVVPRQNGRQGGTKKFAPQQPIYLLLPLLFATERPPGVAVVAQSHAVLFCVFQFGEVPKFFDVMNLDRRPRMIWRAVLAKRMFGEEPSPELPPPSIVATLRARSTLAAPFELVHLAPNSIRQACASRFGAWLLHSTSHQSVIRIFPEAATLSGPNPRSPVQSHVCPDADRPATRQGAFARHGPARFLAVHQPSPFHRLCQIKMWNGLASGLQLSDECDRSNH